MKEEWLNSKQVKNISKLIFKQWGFIPKLDYLFLMNLEGKVYIINKEISQFDISGLNINSIGLYFGRLVSNEFKLTIEGTQLLGKFAVKNVISLNDEQVKDWLRGFNLNLEGKHPGFVIIKYKENYLGCGKHKENKLFNLIPKERRIVSLRGI